MGFENPSVAKQIKLARSVARGVIDRDLKPDVAERRHISALLRLPPTRPLPLEGKQLLWKFRFSLREVLRPVAPVQPADWLAGVFTFVWSR